MCTARGVIILILYRVARQQLVAVIILSWHGNVSVLSWLGELNSRCSCSIVVVLLRVLLDVFDALLFLLLLLFEFADRNTIDAASD